ncbi:unnamed protein product, partial [Mesorhabditis spiculigera]
MTDDGKKYKIRSKGLPEKTPEKLVKCKKSRRWKDTAFQIIRVLLIAAGGVAVFFWICSQRNPSNGSQLPFVGETIYPVPYEYQLRIPPRVGQTIHVAGNVSENAKSICVSLMRNSTEGSTLLFKLCSFFVKDTGLTDGYSEVTVELENRTLVERVANPYERSGDYDLRVRVLGSFAQVFSQGGEIGLFDRGDYAVNEGETLSIHVDGDFEAIRLITIDG